MIISGSLPATSKNSNRDEVVEKEVKQFAALLDLEQRTGISQTEVEKSTLDLNLPAQRRKRR